MPSLKLVDVLLGRVACEDVDHVGLLRVLLQLLHLEGLLDLDVGCRLWKGSQVLQVRHVLACNRLDLEVLLDLRDRL